MKPHRFLYFLFQFLIIAALVGCGGGSSSSDTDDSGLNNTPGSDTGSVALMLTDGPADDYDEIWITVSRALLLSAVDDSQVVIFDPETPVAYDLLNLRPEDEDDSGALLAIEEVPAGIYSKIRLEVESVQAKTILPDGSEETTEFMLPSRKIDLNPRGQFEITQGSSIAITLDIDCDKSIHISGNNKNFRPVVFVDIEPVDFQQRCPRTLHGTIAELTYAADETTVTGFSLTILQTQNQIPVLLDEGTVILDDEGMVADAQALAVEDTVYVRGRLQEDGLLASMVVVGEVTQFEGIVGSPVFENQFVLSNEDELTISLIPDTTLILWRCDDSLAPEAIQTGMQVRVIGKEQEGEIVAIAVLLRPRVITGELTAMEQTQDGHFLTVETQDSNGTTEVLSIFLPADAPANVKFDGALTAEQLMELVNCQSRRVQIPVVFTTEYPLMASKVTVLPDPLYATAIEVDAEQYLLTTDAGLVSITSDAHIFDLTLTDRLRAEVSDIVLGDLLLMYGLPLCTLSDDAPEFEASVILILPEMPAVASAE